MKIIKTAKFKAAEDQFQWRTHLDHVIKDVQQVMSEPWRQSLNPYERGDENWQEVIKDAIMENWVPFVSPQHRDPNGELRADFKEQVNDYVYSRFGFNIFDLTPEDIGPVDNPVADDDWADIVNQWSQPAIAEPYRPPTRKGSNLFSLIKLSGSKYEIWRNQVDNEVERRMPDTSVYDLLDHTPNINLLALYNQGLSPDKVAMKIMQAVQGQPYKQSW